MSMNADKISLVNRCQSPMHLDQQQQTAVSSSQSTVSLNQQVDRSHSAMSFYGEEISTQTSAIEGINKETKETACEFPGNLI